MFYMVSSYTKFSCLFFRRPQKEPNNTFQDENLIWEVYTMCSKIDITLVELMNEKSN
jgi:hypothetical protein